MRRPDANRTGGADEVSREGQGGTATGEGVKVGIEWVSKKGGGHLKGCSNSIGIFDCVDLKKHHTAARGSRIWYGRRLIS